MNGKTEAQNAFKLNLGTPYHWIHAALGAGQLRPSIEYERALGTAHRFGLTLDAEYYSLYLRKRAFLPTGEWALLGIAQQHFGLFGGFRWYFLRWPIAEGTGLFIEPQVGYSHDVGYYRNRPSLEGWMLRKRRLDGRIRLGGQLYVSKHWGGALSLEIFRRHFLSYRTDDPDILVELNLIFRL